MEKLRVIIGFSGGASGYRYLLEHDPNLNVLYEIVGGFTDKEEASGIQLFKKPLVIEDYRQWCEKKGFKRNNLSARDLYFKEIVSLLENLNADLILLSGFMLVLTPSILNAFQNRIINVHPARLDIKDDNGKPRYTGDNAVHKAMEAGDKETFSSVHVVTADVDCGPLICMSGPCPVRDGITPDMQQEKMKTHCDGPAIVKALHMIATNRFRIGVPNVPYRSPEPAPKTDYLSI